MCQQVESFQKKIIVGSGDDLAVSQCIRHSVNQEEKTATMNLSFWQFSCHSRNRYNCCCFTALILAPEKQSLRLKEVSGADAEQYADGLRWKLQRLVPGADGFSLTFYHMISFILYNGSFAVMQCLAQLRPRGGEALSHPVDTMSFNLNRNLAAMGRALTLLADAEQSLDECSSCLLRDVIVSEAQAVEHN